MSHILLRAATSNQKLLRFEQSGGYFDQIRSAEIVTPMTSLYVTAKEKNIQNNTLKFFEKKAMVISSRIILFRRDNTIMSCSNVMSNLHLANRSQMKSSQSGKPMMSSSQDEHHEKYHISSM